MNSKELLDEKYGLVKPKKSNLETDEIVDLRNSFFEQLEHEKAKAKQFDCSVCEDTKLVWRGKFKVTCSNCK